MKHLFVVNERENIEKTYEDLLADLNKSEFEFTSSQTRIYELYLQLIVSILLDREMHFVNSSLQEQSKTTTIIKNPFQFSTIDSYLEIIKNNINWKLELETSGTTGIPKKVIHTFPSLTRSIKINPRRSADVWGLAYNPQHMAGLQVFLQAFLNKNTIVNLFGLDKDRIYSCIGKYNISHLSATPTFYKLLLPSNDDFENVKQVTFGGEKFSEGLRTNLEDLFPKAKFTNVYASTEAGALFASSGNNFVISEKINPFVKIVDNELLIHKSIMSNSKDLKLENDWYATGDLVNVINNHPVTFNFISRKNEMINVGGSKVNPNEVEEIIMKISGVVDVKVFGNPNSLMGNILCAEIVSESHSEKEIKIFVKKHLPEYMVPRVIKFVSEITITATGKKSRI